VAPGTLRPILRDDDRARNRQSSRRDRSCLAEIGRLGEIGPLGEKAVAAAFINGVIDFAGAALLVTLAPSVSVVVTNTKTIDTVLHSMEGLVAVASSVVYLSRCRHPGASVWRASLTAGLATISGEKCKSGDRLVEANDCSRQLNITARGSASDGAPSRHEY